MLPAEHRMRRGEDFSCAVRRGRRSGSAQLVAHLWTPARPHDDDPPRRPTAGRTTSPTPPPARVGFVVSKAVGNAVVRTRVKRRLRAVTRELLAVLPAGALLVVRANPVAASATSAELAHALHRSLTRLVGR